MALASSEGPRARLRRLGRVLALTPALLVCPRAAAAQPLAPGALPITTSRAEGAAACPDDASLAARVVALRPEGAPEGLRVDVRFEHDGQYYTATLQTSGSLQATRVLRAPGPGCEGLADATAVSISLLFDLPAEPPPSPRSPPFSSSSPSNAPPAGLAPALRPASWVVSIAAGGGVSWALPYRLGGLVAVEGLVEPIPSLALGVGGALGPSRSVEKGEGKVDVDVRFAFARACWLWGHQGGLRAGPCFVPALGRLRGRGQGYLLDREVNRAWYALGGGLLASGTLSGPFGWLAEGTALVPLRRESFSVDDVGRAYRSPPVGVLTSASLTVQIH